MPKPKTNPEQRIRAYRLWKDGEGQTAIRNALEEEFNNPVSERTVATWIKEFKSLSPEKVDLDAPYEWHRMDRYGLPWEASGYLIKMLYINEMRRSSDRAAAIRNREVNPTATVIITPQLTFREALWCWRVHLALPDVGTVVGVQDDVWFLAKQFASREIFADVLAEPLYMADLESLLVYKPWLDFHREEVRHQAYHRAVEEGAIPPLLPRSELTSKALNVWAGPEARTLEENVAGIEKVMHLTAAYHSQEHADLLESQQRDLLMSQVRARKAEGGQLKKAKKEDHNDEA